MVGPMEDVLIIGGGAAGLSAALMLSRVRRRVLVVDSGSPHNAPAAAVHGFLSRDGTPPAELLAVGRAEVLKYGGRIISGEVRALRRTASGFQAQLSDQEVLARRVIVATGLRDELPDIPGLRSRWGRDVLHCPYCHGWEVRDQPLGVLGWQPPAVHQALLLRQLSDDVLYFADVLDPGDRATLLARGVRVMDGKVTELILADDRLHALRLADGSIVPRSALFVPPRPIPNDSLLAALGCDRTDTGLIRVDPTGLTTIPGLYAIGNVTDPMSQVITAASTGTKAAAAINADLLSTPDPIRHPRHRSAAPSRLPATSAHPS